MSSGIGEAPSQDAEAPPAPAVGGGAGGGAGAGAGMGSGSDGKTGDAVESSATLAMIGEVGNLGLGEDDADEEDDADWVTSDEDEASDGENDAED